MPNSLKRLCTRLLVILVVLNGSLVSADKYDKCKEDIQRIWNNNITIRGFNRDTLSPLFYTGPIKRFDGNAPRFMLEGNITDDMYMPFTYPGCKEVCGNPVVLNNVSTGLSISATWIFPLAILFCLPYESLHHKRKRKTLAALSYWLGSPQTSLTASVWNFYQTRSCRQRIRAGDSEPEWKDAFYVLSCFNQFVLPGLEIQARDDDEDRLKLLHTLVYGLFLPLSTSRKEVIPDPERVEELRERERREQLEKDLIKELLSTLAYQLRMLRRRGVVPTLASLVTFLLAFVFSVILAFADLKESTTVFILDLALLFSWLPVLVIFTIVDRNPISSERQAELLSRWLFNVDAISNWSNPTNQPAQPAPLPQVLVPTEQHPETAGIRWWPPIDHNMGCFRVGDFIGQGRRMEYCGLTEAVLNSTKSPDKIVPPFTNWTPDKPVEIAAGISAKLKKRLPWAWIVIAVLCLVIVLADTMMAFMSDFITPPVGLGCWSLSVLIYAFMSTVSWGLQLRRHPPTWVRVVSHSCNAAAIICLVGITGTILTGVMNNCFCRSTMPGFTVRKRDAYMDFEGFGFYRKHFDLVTWWGFATAIGSLIQLGALITGLRWWSDCKPMWDAPERGGENSHELRRRDMNWEWLR